MISCGGLHYDTCRIYSAHESSSFQSSMSFTISIFLRISALQICSGKMSSLLRLPRELRDRVYEACLVASKPIDLRNLAPSRIMHLHQRLGLTPNLLASCQQVYEEAILKLYEENLFFSDLTSSWRLFRPLKWCNCFGLQAGQLDICIACQRTSPIDRTTDNEPLIDAWNPNLGRIRRLQISLQHYTYSQWKYRQPSAFPHTSRHCSLMTFSALPSQLRLSLLIIRTLEPSLLSLEDSRHHSHWNAVSFGYNVGDVERWKLEGTEDLSRLVESVLRFARQQADLFVMSGPGKIPYLWTTTMTTPTYIRDYLKTGRYLRAEALDAVRVQSDIKIFTPPRKIQERIVAIAVSSGIRAVCLNGEDVAFTSIYDSLPKNE